MSLHTHPRPVIWRLVRGMVVIYLVALTFLPFQETRRCTANHRVPHTFYVFFRISIIRFSESAHTFDSRLHTRPHPAIWRLVHGMAVIFHVTLTFLPFQETR
ncbi:hypothetical protein OROMI_008571 [Orobanche minor]